MKPKCQGRPASGIARNRAAAWPGFGRRGAGREGRWVSFFAWKARILRPTGQTLWRRPHTGAELPTLRLRCCTLKETPMNPADTPRRRRFLRTATVGGAALAAPMVSRAQTTSLRFQSTWPAKDIFHEYAQDFAKKVNDMAGGRLKIEVLPSAPWCPPSAARRC